MAETPGKHLIVIGGPTASGKTSLAIEVAQHFETEIVSADSRQLYKELNIGVARPSAEELELIPHHFIAGHSIFDPLNAGAYAKEAREVIDELFTRHDVVVVAGGTGLYIKALLEGFDPLPPANEALRSELNALYIEKGIKGLQAYYRNEVKDKDAKIDQNNPQRLIRAIEIAGYKNSIPENEVILDFRTKFSLRKWCIDINREELYLRINKRVDGMMTDGLEDEARLLYPHRDLNPLRTVGYSELFSHFDGEISRDEAVSKIKQHSRNYAKRQITWFKGDGMYQWITPQEFKKIRKFPFL